MKSTSRASRENVREARRANDLQAQANALNAQYQAQAASDAQAARLAAEEQALNTASYHQSLWRQSADGRAWNAWALQAQTWVQKASGHDEALLSAWKEAAVPGWEKGPIAQERLRADRWMSLAWGALAVSIGGSLIGIIAYNIVGGHNWLGLIIGGLTDFLNWMVPVSLVAVVVIWLKTATKRGNLETLVGRSQSASDFAAQYGANPFTDPENLPSWRPGLTCTQSAKDIAIVQSYISLPLGTYPAPSQLPVLPQLQVRDLNQFPPTVADALRARMA